MHKITVINLFLVVKSTSTTSVNKTFESFLQGIHSSEKESAQFLNSYVSGCKINKSSGLYQVKPNLTVSIGMKRLRHQQV